MLVEGTLSGGPYLPLYRWTRGRVTWAQVGLHGRVLLNLLGTCLVVKVVGVVRAEVGSGRLAFEAKFGRLVWGGGIF